MGHYCFRLERFFCLRCCFLEPCFFERRLPPTVETLFISGALVAGGAIGVAGATAAGGAFAAAFMRGAFAAAFMRGAFATAFLLGLDVVTPILL